MRAAESAVAAEKGPQRPSTRRSRRRGFGANLRLTPRTPREAADVAAGIGRMLGGLGRRGAAGDMEALRALRELEHVLQAEQLRAAHGLNLEHNYSWAEIGQAIGISRQAAWQRWGQR